MDQNDSKGYTEQEKWEANPMIKYEELDAQFLIDIVPEYQNEIVMEE